MFFIQSVNKKTKNASSIQTAASHFVVTWRAQKCDTYWAKPWLPLRDTGKPRNSPVFLQLDEELAYTHAYTYNSHDDIEELRRSYVLKRSHPQICLAHADGDLHVMSFGQDRYQDLEHEVRKAGSMRGIDGDVATDTEPATVYRALPKLVNVSGTANAPLGYRLRNVIEHRSLKPKIPDDRYEAIVNSLATDKRLALLMQDERRHERKLINIRIQKIVDQGMEAYEQDLEERRDKLRKLLVIEEAELTRELVLVAKKIEEERQAELVARAAQIEEESKAARQELIYKKQLQQFIEINPDLREIRRHAWTVDAKRANVEQISETQQRRKRECDEEAYWHQLMLDRCNAEEAIEAQNASIRANVKHNLVNTLREQMEAKSRYPPSEDIADINIKILPLRDPAIEKQLRQEKNLKLRKDLETQLLEVKRSLEKRRSEEQALDNMTWNLNNDAVASRLDEKRDRESRRTEILAFMKNLQAFREAVAQREAEAEKCAQRWAKEMDDKTRDALCRTKEKRKKINQELKLAWDRQLEEKRNRQQQELDPAYDPGLTSTNEVLKKEDRARRHRVAQDYGRQLLSQHEHQEKKRIRDLQELDENYKLQMAEKEREERIFMEEMSQLSHRLKKSSIP